jgi:hypothetical protein
MFAEDIFKAIEKVSRLRVGAGERTKYCDDLRRPAAVPGADHDEMFNATWRPMRSKRT